MEFTILSCIEWYCYLIGTVFFEVLISTKLNGIFFSRKLIY